MTDFDNPWKEVLDGLFKECLELFFPELHAAIDWSRECESLEQELRGITREGEIGLKIADKLVKVWRIDGNETWLLLHLEVQNQRVQDFPERMFTSYYRIRDNYGVYPVSLAIFGDSQNSWRPDQFLHEKFSCSLAFKFPVVKLSDFGVQRDVLEASKNPFARVVLAHLATLETHGAPAARYVEKVRLIKSLLLAKWSRLQLLCLLRFVDWLMQLPPELERSCKLEIDEFERGEPMPYVTSFERIAREDGVEEGLQKGLEVIRSGIRATWDHRFQSVPQWMVTKLQSLNDVDRLEQLFKLSLKAALPEIEEQLS